MNAVKNFRILLKVKNLLNDLAIFKLSLRILFLERRASTMNRLILLSTVSKFSVDH
jgi:hypothetical protein